MKNREITRVMFVCLGNICRSPTAHGVFQKMVDDAELGNTIEVESSGTSSWHIGEPPDRRSTAEAARMGYDLSGLRGRQVNKNDFWVYDYILAMDEENLANLETIKPQEFEGYLGLFLNFASNSEFKEVPDPYHGGGSGFHLVLNLVEDASQGLLKEISVQ